MVTAPPIIDFEPFYSTDPNNKDLLIQQIRHACERHGFFQLINHQIPSDLLQAILHQSREVFGLPLEAKEKYSIDIEPRKLGYERLRAQNFEKRGLGDLKEGFYFCRDLPPDHPSIGRFLHGVNKYPTELHDLAAFRRVVGEYQAAMGELARNIMRVIAQSLDLEEHWFDDFCADSANILRLLRYPPQEVDETGVERGIGAHTDFGGITILLQDDTGGLQVWDRESSQWASVVPFPGALVVNLGNLLMRWTNDRYLSNLHRVINTSGRERYSVPFFCTGNLDYTVECIPGCRAETEEAKYPPITVQEWMEKRYADTYGQEGEGELSRDVGRAVDG
ncbi:oxidoreductase [Aspergillus heteromorphus CBS 117.55]|uniref:Oxidoreductase n=1 Tax=Aspergillus heteromorphus CBS 117.55 TaxID=1448321 RepID=A0A317UWC2_9EURO|nr:oxidoreductase [Aspergillus heteromorphus CBS 117.55]PWY65975.1 oxidoreductase [Aspergillus heteromorphus CBS 117.55]